MNLIIKSTILVLPLSLSLTSCSESSAKELTKPATKPQVIDIKGEAFIKLDEGEAVTIIQSEKKNRRTLVVGNLEGILTAMQLEEGGKSPIMLKLTSADKAEVWTEREKYVVYIDDDGDGIVDRKTDRSGMYKVKKIEWEKVTPKK